MIISCLRKKFEINIRLELKGNPAEKAKAQNDWPTTVGIPYTSGTSEANQKSIEQYTVQCNPSETQDPLPRKNQSNSVYKIPGKDHFAEYRQLKIRIHENKTERKW